MITHDWLAKQLPWLAVMSMSTLVQDSSRTGRDDFPLSPSYGQVFIAKGSVWVMLSVRGVVASTPSGSNTDTCFTFPQALQMRLKNYNRDDYRTVSFELAFTEKEYNSILEGTFKC